MLSAEPVGTLDLLCLLFDAFNVLIEFKHEVIDLPPFAIKLILSNINGSVIASPAFILEVLWGQRTLWIH